MKALDDRLHLARRLFAWGLLFWLPVAASAQVLITNDDEYGVRFDEPLIVEPFGVMDNDTVDGNNAGEEGATVTLVSGVSHGTLTCLGVGPGLCADGSFEYQFGATFSGLDSFTYQATLAGVTSPVTTVNLTACTGGPLYSCWERSAFLAKLASLGQSAFIEAYTGTPWDVARAPTIVPSVDSMGIHWTTNHPAHTSLTTFLTLNGSGDYGASDPSHGFATCQLTSCSPTVCDVNNPPAECLYHDGLSGSLISGTGAIRAVGALIDSNTGGAAGIAIVLDGVTEVAFAHPVGYDQEYHFYGVIDTGPTGFTHFEVRETDGKVGQGELIFFDDFDVVIDGVITADGDLAPRGLPDGTINVGDLLVAQQIVLGQIVPTADEIAHGDLYPTAGGDGQITLSDLMLLWQMVLAVP